MYFRVFCEAGIIRHGLEESEKDIQAEKAAVEEKLKELKEQRADVEKLIQQELKPQAEYLTYVVSVGNQQDSIEMRCEDES